MRLLFVACIILLGACAESRAPTVIHLPDSAAPGSAEPHLSRAADGTVVLSWLEPFGSGESLRYSVLQQDAWSVPTTVASGDDWFVNWADFPSVVKIGQGLWAAHWLQKRPGGAYAYDVSIALSQDDGRTWGNAITPHTDGTATVLLKKFATSTSCAPTLVHGSPAARSPLTTGSYRVARLTVPPLRAMAKTSSSRGSAQQTTHRRSVSRGRRMAVCRLAMQLILR
jgi:hypothetical protein